MSSPMVHHKREHGTYSDNTRGRYNRFSKPTPRLTAKPCHPPPPFFLPWVVWIVPSNRALDVRNVEPPVTNVVDSLVGHPHERARPCCFVLEHVRLGTDNDLVSTATVHAHSDQVSHRATAYCTYGSVFICSYCGY